MLFKDSFCCLTAVKNPKAMKYSHIVQKSGVTSNLSSPFLQDCIFLLFFVTYGTKYLLIFWILEIPKLIHWLGSYTGIYYL